MPFSRKMLDVAFAIVLNVVMAILIYGNAEAGRLLGITTLSLNFSAVWPATGFALAGLLLFGYRLAPGIFFGNFAYNALHLYLHGHTLYGPLFSALAISTGSLAQALVGCYALRRFCSPYYFSSVRDVVMFLLFGGVVTCFIASSIGVLTLVLYHELAYQDLLFTWLTFWIGDTMGIYIFTPLVLVWSIYKPAMTIWHYGKEFVGMLIIFAFLSTFAWMGYPLGYLFIPFMLWVTYRFSFHGATLCMVLIALITIIPFSIGKGPLIVNFTAEMLVIIVSFLEIVASTSLLFGGLISERDRAWELIKKHRVDLLHKS